MMANPQREVEAVERQRQALELRKAGVPYSVIAARLGYRGPSGAYAAVRAALRKTLQEPANELRRLEEARLDALLMAIWPQVQKGAQGAIDRALRIMERRAKLLGLDSPIRTEHSGTDGGPIIVQFVEQYADTIRTISKADGLCEGGG